MHPGTSTWPVPLPIRFTLLAALTLVLVGTFTVSPARAFSDVPPSHPYYAAVSHLFEEEILSGYPDGTFRPDGLSWRQHFAKMVVLTFGLPVSETDVCPFGDVVVGGPETLYPDNYVAVGAATGITRGVTSTHFEPDRNVTRAQAITMVVRGLDDLHSGALEPVPSEFVSIWGDFSPDHAATARVAEYNGLLQSLGKDTGHPDGNLATLDPWVAMPRGELAQLLDNVLDLLEQTGPPVPPTLEGIHDPDEAMGAGYAGCAGTVCHKLNLLSQHLPLGLACDACHGVGAPPPAAAAIAAYAATGQKQGCFNCHDAAAFHGDAAAAHQASQRAPCTDCHLLDLPAEHARLSATSAAEACAACHPLPDGFSWNDQCTGCHTSGGPAPAAHSAGPSHPSPTTSCQGTGCHTSDLVSIHAPTAGGCTTCHSTTSVPTDPTCGACHADGSFHGGAAAAHQPTPSAGSCATPTCHPGASLPAIHDDTCSYCHGATSPTTSECTGCHSSPHAVPEPYKNSCDQCHAISGPGAGLHDTHAVTRGIACSNCHSTRLPSCVSAACHEHDTATIHDIGQHQSRPCTFCHTSGAPGHGPSPFKYGLTPSEFRQPCLTSGCHELESHMNTGDCVDCHGPGGNRDVHTEEERHVRDRATCAICHDLGQNSFTDCGACHTF